jgi:hypothetical protein
MTYQRFTTADGTTVFVYSRGHRPPRGQTPSPQACSVCRSPTSTRLCDGRAGKRLCSAPLCDVCTTPGVPDLDFCPAHAPAAAARAAAPQTEQLDLFGPRVPTLVPSRPATPEVTHAAGTPAAEPGKQSPRPSPDMTPPRGKAGSSLGAPESPRAPVLVTAAAQVTSPPATHPKDCPSCGAARAGDLRGVVSERAADGTWSMFFLVTSFSCLVCGHAWSTKKRRTDVCDHGVMLRVACADCGRTWESIEGQRAAP